LHKKYKTKKIILIEEKRIFIAAVAKTVIIYYLQSYII
jgi:hypothetical protein